MTRSYVTSRTSGAERTWKVAQLTAVQYAGFTVTPFVGSLFSALLGDADYSAGPFRVTAFTAAAYFLTLLGALCWVALTLAFSDDDERKGHSARALATKPGEGGSYGAMGSFPALGTAAGSGSIPLYSTS